MQKCLSLRNRTSQRLASFPTSTQSPVTPLRRPKLTGTVQCSAKHAEKRGAAAQRAFCCTSAWVRMAMGHEWEGVTDSPAPVKQLREAEQAPGPQAGQVTAVPPAPEQRGHSSHPRDPQRAAVREAAGGRPPAPSGTPLVTVPPVRSVPQP